MSGSGAFYCALFNDAASKMHWLDRAGSKIRIKLEKY